VRNKLAWVLGRPPTTGEVIATFSNFSHCLAESLGSERRAARLCVSGMGHVERALSHGRGVVLFTAHTGAWDLVASCFARDVQRELVLVMEAEPNARARIVHERVRKREGVRTVYVGTDPFAGLGLLAELAAGRVVAFQLDRAPRSARMFDTTLFGRHFPIPEGPLRLARATGAPLLAAFCSRVGFLEHRLEVGPPSVVTRPGSAGLTDAAQAVAVQFQDFLGRYPCQWFGFEPMPFDEP
jgi:KDO2-lipid IV(A) lauroyltransferase